jgi:hypothetical protein
MCVGDPGCSRECFASELHACRTEVKNLGLTLRSLVFPNNSVRVLGDLETIFSGVSRYRDAGRLDNLMMGDPALSL